jgi:phospholipid N-methyltransferase
LWSSWEPGPGAYTGELLRRIGPETRLLAFEIDGRLARRLRARFDDTRLEVINDSAEKMAEHLGDERAEVVVSALPFTGLPGRVREAIYAAIASALRPGGVMLAIQYSTARERDLKRLFPSVHRRVSLWNLPPALVYACSTVSAAANTP